MRPWKNHVQFYSSNWENICEKDYFTIFHSDNYQIPLGLLMIDRDLQTPNEINSLLAL